MYYSLKISKEYEKKIKCNYCFEQFNYKKIKISLLKKYDKKYENKPLIWFRNSKMIINILALCEKCGFFNVFDKNFVFLYPKPKKEIIFNNKISETEKNIFNEIEDMAFYKKWELLIMLSRILLKHIAFNNGYDFKNDQHDFKNVVKYLLKKNIINENHKIFADQLMRNWGNKLNHEIKIWSNDAKDKNEKLGKNCFELVKDILKSIYTKYNKK